MTTARITETAGWKNNKGRVYLPSFNQERLIMRGEGDHAYLIGTSNPKHKKTWDGLKAGQDYIYWPEAPQWALNELENLGLSLPEEEKAVKEDPKDETKKQATSDG